MKMKGDGKCGRRFGIFLAKYAPKPVHRRARTCALMQQYLCTNAHPSNLIYVSNKKVFKYMCPLDLERLRITSAVPLKSKQETPKPSVKKAKRFLRGPIPLDWLTQAARQSGKALHVGIALWFLSGLKRSREIALSQSTLNLLGVSRHSGYRGLSKLETAGLISVVRHPGRNPIVTILLPTADRDSLE